MPTMEPTPTTPALATAHAFLNSLNAGGTGLADLIHPSGLIQHNPTLADGLYGLAMALQDCGAKPPRFEVLFSFEAEPYVVMVCTRKAFGLHLGVELLRMEDGRVREHWDNYGVTTPSLIRPLRGHLATLETAPHAAAAATFRSRSKRIVSAFVTEGVIKAQRDALWHLAPGVYREWQAGTGHLRAEAREHAAEAVNPWLFRVVHLHAVISNGPYALAMSEGRSGSHATSHFDLFVLNDRGIVFRMPTDELVPLQEFHRHPTGKFGNLS